MKVRLLRTLVYTKRITAQTIQIIIGAALISAAVMFFLLPNQISTGGFSGIATILYYFLNIPVGLSVIVLNIPLFIVVFIKGGRKYFLGALFGTVILSVLLSIFAVLQPLTEDRLLASIYGGIMSGAGTAVIFKARASTRRNRFIS
ncbi:MAG: YitT family protein [Oscillospiraceae bacterium]|nr:YitT family protein [Oscillospiraceae bacterium]